MKIAVVGTGSIGKRHMSNLLKIGVKNIVAVSEHSRKTSLDIDEISIPVVNDYSNILDSNIDAIVIGNPTSYHKEYLKMAVDSNKHVYMEKPVSVSADGLSEIDRKAQQKKLKIATGTMYRFNERLVSLKKYIDTGELGLILNVETTIGEHIADYHPGEDFTKSYTARSDLGGGVLLTQIHQIDWLNWIFGRFTTVYAVGGKRSNLSIDVEDCVTYLLRNKSDVPVVGNLNYLQRPKFVGMQVIGEKGSLRWDLFDHKLEYVSASNEYEVRVEQSHYNRNDMFIETMNDFIESINHPTKQPRSTLSDGINSLFIVDAIKKSMKSGISENINYA